MKKMLALVLVLAMCLGCAALAEETALEAGQARFGGLLGNVVRPV